jgi:hypothetical protein
VVGSIGRGVVDREAVAVGWDAEDELRGGHTSGDPLGYALIAGALVVARIAGSRQRGVGSGCRGPGAVEVVVLLDVSAIQEYSITGCLP